MNAAAAPKTTFTLRAKATDTGGNSTWSNTLTVNLVADATPPRVVKFLPPNGALSGSLRTLSAVFSEPLDQATLTATRFTLLGAGARWRLWHAGRVPRRGRRRRG